MDRWAVDDSDGSQGEREDRAGSVCPADLAFAALDAPEGRRAARPGAGRPRKPSVQLALSRVFDGPEQSGGQPGMAVAPPGTLADRRAPPGLGPGDADAPLVGAGRSGGSHPPSATEQKLRMIFDAVDPQQPASSRSFFSSTRGISTNLGIDDRRLTESLCVLAEASVRGERDAALALFQVVRSLASQGRIIPIHFAFGRKYDETPLKLRVSWESFGGKRETDDEPAAKLLLVERRFSMVLAEKIEQAEMSDDDFAKAQGQKALLIRGRLSTVLRVFANMTAASLKHALQHALLPFSPGQVFRQEDTIITTDEHASNKKAELYIQEDARAVNEKASFLHVICDVHKCSGVAKKTLALDPDLITKCIQVALFLRQSGAMSRFRRSFVAVLVGSLKVVRGNAGIEASDHREAVINTFLAGTSPKTASFRVAVGSLLNGDWRSGEIRHYCNGCCSSRGATEKALRDFVVPGFVGRKIKVFPRGNWCGADMC